VFEKHHEGRLSSSSKVVGPIIAGTLNGPPFKAYVLPIVEVLSSIELVMPRAIVHLYGHSLISSWKSTLLNLTKYDNYKLLEVFLQSSPPKDAISWTLERLSEEHNYFYTGSDKINPRRSSNPLQNFVNILINNQGSISIPQQILLEDVFSKNDRGIEGHLWLVSEKIDITAVFANSDDELRKLMSSVLDTDGNLSLPSDGQRLSDSLKNLSIWVTWSVIRILYADEKYRVLAMTMYNWLNSFTTNDVGNHPSVDDIKIPGSIYNLTSAQSRTNESGVQCYWILKRLVNFGYLLAGRLEDANHESPLIVVFNCDKPSYIFTPSSYQLPQSVNLHKGALSLVVQQEIYGMRGSVLYCDRILSGIWPDYPASESYRLKYKRQSRYSSFLDDDILKEHPLIYESHSAQEKRTTMHNRDNLGESSSHFTSFPSITSQTKISKPFVCDCGEKFSTSEDLDRHGGSVHNNRDGRYNQCRDGTCVSYGKLFFRRDNFLDHIRRMHQNGSSEEVHRAERAYLADSWVSFKRNDVWDHFGPDIIPE